MPTTAMGSRAMALVNAMYLFTIGCLVALVGADCECGYTALVGNTSSTFLFTDLIETDFLHLPNITLDTDWRRQNFSVTPAAGRGPYGMNFTIDQVVSNSIPDPHNWTGPGIHGGDPGLALTVDSIIPDDGYIKVAEIDSSRTDLLWGSYRTSIKLTDVAGTCSAFFWYFNDSQEIDMEFLSYQFNRETNMFPVNLVLQSQQSVRAGYNAADSGNYIVANLSFDPTTAFHEYRIDFVPGMVVFYADGDILATMTTNAVPSEPGHLVLTQWSNGNPLWSSGPPTKDAAMTISYVKAYFNSSLLNRQSDWTRRCKDMTAPESICTIPDQKRAPDPNTLVGNGTAASTYFFSNEHNKTINQTVFHKSKGTTTGSDKCLMSLMMLFALSILVFLML